MNTLVIALYIANRVLPSSISCVVGDSDAEEDEEAVETWGAGSCCLIKNVSTSFSSILPSLPLPGTRADRSSMKFFRAKWRTEGAARVFFPRASCFEENDAGGRGGGADDAERGYAGSRGCGLRVLAGLALSIAVPLDDGEGRVVGDGDVGGTVSVGVLLVGGDAESTGSPTFGLASISSVSSTSIMQRPCPTLAISPS